MAKRTTSSGTPSANKVKRALASLRPDEPSLDELTDEDQSWLVDAFKVLQKIYEKRETGGIGDMAYCIFAVERGSPYVQFLAQWDAKQLICEAVSAHYVPEMVAILGTEGDAALKKLGFGAKKNSNYWQFIPIESVADLAYAARLSYRTLKHVYHIANITDIKHKIGHPSPEATKPTEFAKELVQQLNLLGAFATRDFRIPGTETALLVYIAFPVRAYVVIRKYGPKHPIAARQLLKAAEPIRHQFGQEIQPILIIHGERSLSPSVEKELQDAGFLVLHAQGPGPVNLLASQCAQKIEKFLFTLPYRFTKKSQNPPGSTAASASSPGLT